MWDRVLNTGTYVEITELTFPRSYLQGAGSDATCHLGSASLLFCLQFSKNSKGKAAICWPQEGKQMTINYVQTEESYVFGNLLAEHHNWWENVYLWITILHLCLSQSPSLPVVLQVTMSLFFITRDQMQTSLFVKGYFLIFAPNSLFTCVDEFSSWGYHGM